MGSVEFVEWEEFVWCSGSERSDWELMMMVESEEKKRKKKKQQHQQQRQHLIEGLAEVEERSREEGVLVAGKILTQTPERFLVITQPVLLWCGWCDMVRVVGVVWLV